MKKNIKKQEVILRKEGEMLVLELNLSKRLRKEMEELAERTAGTIPAL